MRGAIESAAPWRRPELASKNILRTPPNSSENSGGLPPPPLHRPRAFRRARIGFASGSHRVPSSYPLWHSRALLGRSWDALAALLGDLWRSRRAFSVQLGLPARLGSEVGCKCSSQVLCKSSPRPLHTAKNLSKQGKVVKFRGSGNLRVKCLQHRFWATF